MSTQTSPDYLADLWGLGLDFARKNAGIDVETVADDRNIPDTVDQRVGQAPIEVTVQQQAPSSPFSSFTWKHWAGLGLAGGLTYGLVTGKFK